MIHFALTFFASAGLLKLFDVFPVYEAIFKYALLLALLNSLLKRIILMIIFPVNIFTLGLLSYFVNLFFLIINMVIAVKVFHLGFTNTVYFSLSIVIVEAMIKKFIHRNDED